MIEIGKMYNEYSEKELEFLPQIPFEVLQKYEGKTIPYMWDGKTWQWVLID